jgi:hypothetical protein
VSGEKGIPLMAPHLEEGDWRLIAEQASKEMDPQRLMILIGKLCCALEGEHREKSRGNGLGSFIGN